eukprot:m.28389 g.28389  ORF g.28389 m.28389 type:complete len:68 (+) comp7999_c0_seq1:117-320(+)
MGRDGGGGARGRGGGGGGGGASRRGTAGGSASKVGFAAPKAPAFIQRLRAQTGRYQRLVESQSKATQ